MSWKLFVSIFCAFGFAFMVWYLFFNPSGSLNDTVTKVIIGFAGLAFLAGSIVLYIWHKRTRDPLRGKNVNA